ERHLRRLQRLGRDVRERLHTDESPGEGRIHRRHPGAGSRTRLPGSLRRDIDFHTDMMMPTTHASYYDSVKDDIDVLGCWYGAAQNTIAVSEESPAPAVEDGKGMANQID